MFVERRRSHIWTTVSRVQHELIKTEGAEKSGDAGTNRQFGRSFLH
jgi:hypothetical protein